jgi:hypothetical protein
MAGLPWDDHAPEDDGAGVLLPVLPCVSSNAERSSKWAWHRHDVRSSPTRQEMRSRRIEALRAQLRDPSELTVNASDPKASPAAAAAAEATTESVFRPVPEHFKVPHGLWLREATSVAVDSEDRVYVFNRGNMPVMVFDIEGNLIDRWGNATPFDGAGPFPGARNSRWHGTEFIAPHAITIDHEDNLWLVDDSAHCITKCDRHGNRLMMLLPEGALLAEGGSSAYSSGDSADGDAAGSAASSDKSPVVLTTQEEMAAHIGQPHKPPPRHSGRMFNLPTDIAVHPKTGDLFITDGYGNSHVHHLKADGTHVASWGAPGVLDGQFNLPHGIAIHPNLDKLIVCDRENNRVQIFTLGGEFVSSFFSHRACGVCVSAGSVYIAELGAKSAYICARLY